FKFTKILIEGLIILIKILESFLEEHAS
ncbi:MAG: hypothetical protein Lokiarch_13440, partial [Candidatus Lokiarchaeum sp. GC14_75]